MRLKTLDLDLREEIPAIRADGHDEVRILIRFEGSLVGWTHVTPEAPGEETVPADRVRAALVHRGNMIVPSLLGRRRRTLDGRPPSITVVVCTRERDEGLDRCLASLRALDYPEPEVLVIDNASRTDGTRKVAERWGARYAREERPGLDWARNRGIAEARGEIVAFTDDDVQVDRLWLRALARAFADPEVAAVTGMVAPAELATRAQQIFELDYGGMGHGLWRRCVRPAGLRAGDLLRVHAHGCGANMAFRRRLFQEIGSFDVALDAGTPSGGAGDLDMLHRVLTSGRAIVYEPDALVWHTHRRTEDALRRQIFDNGRGFGSYLLTCARRRSVPLWAIGRYAISEWIGGWMLRRLVCPRGLPRRLILAELRGAIASPYYYLCSRRSARRIARLHGAA